MANKNHGNSGHPGAHDGHELHKHPDLAVREAHLAKLIDALKESGMSAGETFGKSGKFAGFVAINPNSELAQRSSGFVLS